MSSGDRYKPGMVQARREDYSDSPDLIASLPHQCQRWEIGGQRHVRQLIQDLEAILPLLEDDRIESE